MSVIDRRFSSLGIKERRQRQELRGGILAAARQIASDQDWQSVTIRKIAGLIEYSPPVIYEYFGSKDEILLELMRLGYAQQLEAVEAAGRAAGDPEDALLGMGLAWLDFAFRSPDLYQVMYGLGGVPFSAAETGKEGEKIGDAVGRVVVEILQRNGKEIDDSGARWRCCGPPYTASSPSRWSSDSWAANRRQSGLSKNSPATSSRPSAAASRRRDFFDSYLT